VPLLLKPVFKGFIRFVQVVLVQRMTGAACMAAILFLTAAVAATMTFFRHSIP
jgi:hypothetical protein